MSAPSGVIASALLAPLLDGPEQPLHVVHRSRLACQLADESGLVRACLVLAGAIRLPHSAVVPFLPGASSVLVGDGSISWDGVRLHVARWWTPPRPHIPALRAFVDDDAAVRFGATWGSRLGLGAGLTPYGDDVICGALVTLGAAGHPLADVVAAEIRRRPLESHTTAPSAGLLRLAAEGYCIAELAAYLTDRSAAAAEQLQSVGHSSGAGLMEGVSSVLSAERASFAA